MMPEPMSVQELSEIIDSMTTTVAKWQSRDDNGWAATVPNAGVRPDTDVWTTAQVLLWLLEKDPSAYADRIESGLEFLRFAQHTPGNINAKSRVAPDNGWGWKTESDSEATATSLALRAFVRYAQLHSREKTKYAPYVAAMRDARDWLLREVVKPDGGIALTKSDPNSSAFNTCWGGIALLGCLDVPELHQPMIQGAIIPRILALLESNRPPIGWGNFIVQRPEPLSVAYCTYFLLYLNRRDDAVPGRLWLGNNQEEDGSWNRGQGPSTIEATTWAMIALLNSGHNPDSWKIRGALRYLCDAYAPQRGWPPNSGEDPQVWTTYYAVQALQAYINAMKNLNLTT